MEMKTQLQLKALKNMGRVQLSFKEDGMWGIQIENLKCETKSGMLYVPFATGCTLEEAVASLCEKLAGRTVLIGPDYETAKKVFIYNIPCTQPVPAPEETGKTAKWELCGKLEAGFYKCSNCKVRVVYSAVSRTPYCSYCGAKMIDYNK